MGGLPLYRGLANAMAIKVVASSGECPKFCVRGLNGYPTMVG